MLDKRSIKFLKLLYKQAMYVEDVTTYMSIQYKNVYLGTECLRFLIDNDYIGEAIARRNGRRMFAILPIGIREVESAKRQILDSWVTRIISIAALVISFLLFLKK